MKYNFKISQKEIDEKVNELKNKFFTLIHPSFDPNLTGVKYNSIRLKKALEMRNLEIGTYNKITLTLTNDKPFQEIIKDAEFLLKNTSKDMIDTRELEKFLSMCKKIDKIVNSLIKIFQENKRADISFIGS